MLLPSGAAATPAEVDAYLATQQGLPATETSAAIATELNRRNDELPEADGFLSAAPVSAVNGATLAVSSPYDAIGFVRSLLFELATPANYALYDPQLNWLIDPAGHIPIAVSHGGAGEFPYLTESLAQLWVHELSDPDPFLVVERANEVYIQTYRHSADEFTLEYRDGSADRHFETTVGNAAEVAALFWAWTIGDQERLDTVPWSRLDL